MANSIFAIKKRINSVKSIKKITNAMSLVALANLQKSKRCLQERGSYFEYTREIVNRVLSTRDNVVLNRFLRNNFANKKKLWIAVGSDLGFAGGFNSNIVKKINELVDTKHDDLVLFGKKLINSIKGENIPFLKEFNLLSNELNFDDIALSTAEIYHLFLKNQYSEINILFYHFETALSQEVTALCLWPFNDTNRNLLTSDNRITVKSVAEIDFEPDEETVVKAVFPKYLSISIYGALVNSKVAENAARQVIMKNATDNAEDLINTLTLDLNRQRQARITQEILEIINARGN